MDVKISVDSKAFNNWQKKAMKNIKAETKAIVKDATLFVEAEAKRLCPVDHGQLRQGIFSTVKGNHGEVSTSPNTPYALFVHEGHWVKEGQVFPIDGGFKRIKETRFIPGQPFMADAFDTVKDDFEYELQKMMKNLK